ncbi:DUF3592 domain-containing protein [Sphingomonas sp. ASY06-1R]|uniref:DUF3592 domain-containing protein n=1 Tax=Sphingomonas sp. ASY06-1R TaxID=3445771 RepID=UPI003FA1BB63
MAGPVVFLCLILSPKFAESVPFGTDDAVTVPASIASCTPRRNGTRKRSEVVCRFIYAVGGKRYAAEDVAWSRNDPFLTSARLDRVLADFRTHPARRARVSRDDPADAALMDERWVTPPPLWLCLLGLFILMAIAIVRLDPSDIPYRRADLAPDPATGYLEPINHHRRNLVRRRLAGQGLAALVAGGICLFGISNQPANVVAQLGMTSLRPVPARLVDCEHRYYRAGRTGHDQLNCDFRYRIGGRLYRGSAEAVRFGLIPTAARMDAEVARLQTQPQVTAYVDPRHPGYAWAFLRNDIFLPFSWGLFELQLCLLVLVSGGIIGASIVRGYRAA